jgi:phosphohistidine phosphatase
MKTLFLIRHAKSSWGNQDLKDADRPLNDRGRKDAPLMARRMASNWAPPDGIFCSRALRARETANIMNQFWWKDREITIDGKLYEEPASSILNIIAKKTEEFDSLALVFHNPTITYLSNVLASLTIPNSPTCGIVILKSQANDWKSVQPGKCELIDFDFPKREH